MVFLRSARYGRISFLFFLKKKSENLVLMWPLENETKQDCAEVLLADIVLREFRLLREVLPSARSI